MGDKVLAGDKWIPEDEYRVIVDRVPIVCVDLLPLLAGTNSFGLIKRETYDGKHGLNLVGGAVLIDEPLIEAVQRHLLATLGPKVSLDVGSLQLIGIYQYFRDERPGCLFDPRKNAVSISYSGVVSGLPEPQGEAIGFQMFPSTDPPPLSAFGFGQGVVVYDGLRDHRL